MTYKDITYKALQDAIVKVGSQKKLGALAGVTQSVVARWDKIPDKHVREIMINAPDGLFTARELRPDNAELYSSLGSNA